MKKTSASNNSTEWQPYLSPIAVWALSVGSAIGWGSLVVTSTSYLSQAGPAGSIIGLLIGFVMMLMVSSHYHFLGNRYPGTGGLYHYVKKIFGYDFAFLIAWFMFLIYISIFWANATSIPLFARYFLQGVFQKFYLFTVFGYDVYLGEVLLTLAVIWLIGLLCMKSKKATARSMVVMTLIFTIGITVCFVIAMTGHKDSGMTMSPAFLPDTDVIRQVIRIAFISPWAFIGFESISHASAEYRMKHSSLFRIFVISVAVTTALYVFITLLSVSAYPEGCTSWLDYISRLNEFEGIEGLPVFYAAHYYLGDAGVYILMASLLSLVLTSLIGMLRTVSRLCYSVAQDGILPKRFAKLNNKRIPAKAILLVLLVSLPIPFLGRTATGWIVDITTIGATIIYGFVSIAVFKVSGKEGVKLNRFISGICLFILVAFMAFLLFPSAFSDYTLKTETYVLMAVWSILGLVYFNFVIRKDNERKFGRAFFVWIGLLIFAVLNGMTWSTRLNEEKESMVMAEISSYNNGTADSETLAMDNDEFLAVQLDRIYDADNASAMIIAGLFGVSLVVMFVNYSTINKWEKKAASERDKARTAALTDPMTGVKSKHAFLLNEKEINASIKEGAAGKFAIVVCDVNGLKKINDTYGHKAGDEYIRESCSMVCDIFQHSPVFRVGGDEFTVILTDRDYALRKDLMAALHDRSVDHITAGGAVISGGLSNFRAGEDESVHDVFQRADERMYEEKKLLKSLGAVTRDDSEDEEQKTALAQEAEDQRSIIKVKRHLLIVDDEELNRDILSDSLENGYELLYAADGYEALEQVRTHKDKLALILLDLQMPRLTGKEVLRILKNDEELMNIPVIVMTADEKAELECLNLGALDFIPKPYPMWEIIRARVNKCIELSEDRAIIRATERDSLTSLFNIDYFLRYVKMYDQNYWDMPMDAVVVDVNQFRLINERCGRQYGDKLLQRIGERVRTLSRKLGGVGSRQGADTFLIYCPHQENYSELLNQLSEDLTEDKDFTGKVQLRLGVYSEVDKNLEIRQRFDKAKLAADSVKCENGETVGFSNAEC